MTGRLEGKVALITGAARGQGRSHALRLAEEGADIIALDICRQISSVPYPMATPADLVETTSLIEALDRRVVAREVDIRDAEAVSAAYEEGIAQFERIDVVVANAGIFSMGAVTELPQQSWQDMQDVTLTGTWNVCRAAIPHMTDGGRGGSIIITSSVLGLKGMQYLSHYAAAKHGLVGLARSLALELAPLAIRVNTVHPTSVDTPMIMNRANFQLVRPDLPDPGRDDIAEALATINALAVPWIDPIDISNAVLFLASDEARYITGVALPVDAGAVIK